jgi:hypothetical protein
VRARPVANDYKAILISELHHLPLRDRQRIEADAELLPSEAWQQIPNVLSETISQNSERPSQVETLRHGTGSEKLDVAGGS